MRRKPGRLSIAVLSCDSGVDPLLIADSELSRSDKRSRSTSRDRKKVGWEDGGAQKVEVGDERRG